MQSRACLLQAGWQRVLPIGGRAWQCLWCLCRQRCLCRQGCLCRQLSLCRQGLPSTAARATPGTWQEVQVAGAGSLSLMCESLRVGSLCLYIYMCVCVCVCFFTNNICTSGFNLACPRHVACSLCVCVCAVFGFHFVYAVGCLCVCVHVATWSCMWV